MNKVGLIKKSCVVEYKNMRLVPLSANEIENLRKWRNDQEQTQFLRKIGHITKEAQKAWFEDYLTDDTQIIFSIYETGSLNRMVGSVALYNINLEKGTSEVGRIQIGDPEAHGKGLGRVSLVGTIKVAFKCLDITKIEASVHKENVQAHHNDIKIGFRIVGEIDSIVGGKEDLIEMTEEDAIKANAYYNDIEIKLEEIER